MEITVTQAHINAGKRRSYQHCPVALALKDMGYKFPWVAAIDIELDCSVASPKGIATTDELRRFVNDFDVLGPAGVSPSTFKLSIN